MPATLNALAKGGRMVIVGSHAGSEWTIDPGDRVRKGVVIGRDDLVL